MIRTTIKFFYLWHGIEPTPTQGCPLPTVGHLHINVGNPASGGNNAICGGNGIRTFSIYGNSSFLQMFQGSRLMLCRLCLGVNLPIFSAHHPGKTQETSRCCNSNVEIIGSQSRSLIALIQLGRSS